MGHQHFLCCACMHVEHSFVVKNTSRVGDSIVRIGVTYKVRSLGMWLKLETGMLLMLLLFRVL